MYMFMCSVVNQCKDGVEHKSIPEREPVADTWVATKHLSWLRPAQAGSLIFFGLKWGSGSGRLRPAQSLFPFSADFQSDVQGSGKKASK